MKRYLLCLLCLLPFLTARADDPPLTTGFYEAESDVLIGAYTGAGWAQLVDGDYVVMESSQAGDSVSFAAAGDQVVIYRELLAEGGASANICIDALCSTFDSTSSSEQRGVPVAYEVANGEGTVTITNADGGILRLDSFLILARPQLEQVAAPEPAREYLTLPTGEIVALDRSISGGDIVLAAFVAALGVLELANVVVAAWRK